MARTLVVVLKSETRMIRMPNIGDALARGEWLLVFGPDGKVKARFNLRDLLTWHLED